MKTPTDWFSPGRFALLLGLLIAIPFYEVLFGTQCFVAKDFALYSYPIAWYHRQCFWHGEIPLWDPLNCCGIPFLAQLNTIVLYPLSLIYLLLPMPWSLPIFSLVHQFIAGMGMYFLARRWTGSSNAAALAGVIMAFNGLTLNFLMCANYIAAFAWMPWVILAAEIAWLEGGRKILLAGLVAALQILSGGPETILFTWVILFLLALILFVKNSVSRQKFVSRFILVGAVAGALAAAQLFPFLDLLAHSQRDKNYGASIWSMPPWGWGNFLLPTFQGIRWHQMIIPFGQNWTSSYYAGIATILLAGVALWRERQWRVWFAAFIFLASIVLALGDNGGVYLWLRQAVPAIGFARYPIKFTILSLWALPLLAAFGWHHFEKLKPGEKSSSRYLLAAIFAVAILLMLRFARHFPIEEDLFPAIKQNAISRLALLTATLLALSAFLKFSAFRKWTTFSFLLLIWFDLLSHMPWQNPTVDPSVYDPAIARMKLKLNPEPALGQSRLLISPSANYRIFYKAVPDLKENFLLHRVVFFSNCNLIDGLPKGDGLFPLYLRDMNRIADSISSGLCNLEQLEDLMSVSQTTAPGTYFDWAPRTTYLPMVTAGQKPVFADDQETYNAVTQGSVNFRKTVYLPKEAAAFVTVKSNTTAKVTVKNFQAEHATFEVEAKEPSLVFISQSFYHNWKAYVDGSPVPLWQANSAFQALQTPMGRHEIKLVYEDRAFFFGAILSLTAVVGYGAGWMVFRRKI